MAIRIQSNDEIARDQARALAQRRSVDNGYKALAEAVNRVGRPPSGKVRVTMLLKPETIAKFKATGPGWQSRMSDALDATQPRS